MVLDVEVVDTTFGTLDLVEVFVDCCGLRFAEADEVDDVGENFDEAVVCRFEEVGEGEVINATLYSSILSVLEFFGALSANDGVTHLY